MWWFQVLYFGRKKLHGSTLQKTWHKNTWTVSKKHLFKFNLEKEITEKNSHHSHTWSISNDCTVSGEHSLLSTELFLFPFMRPLKSVVQLSTIRRVHVYRHNVLTVFTLSWSRAGGYKYPPPQHVVTTPSTMITPTTLLLSALISTT